MNQTYIHTFKNGQRLTLTVDLSAIPPKVTCVPKITCADEDFSLEYRKWRDEVVQPGIVLGMLEKIFLEDKNHD